LQNQDIGGIHPPQNQHPQEEKMRLSLTIIIASTLFFGLPLGALAMKGMEHGKQAETMDHGSMDHGNHDGMAMEGDMIMLGNAVEDGVKAMAHLKDVAAAMAKMGMDATHHIMIMFTDQASGDTIESGIAAVKIERPDGTESGPIKLMGMQGHFGADIELSEPGKYEFKVGTKLADGKQRQFEFEFTLK